MHSNVRLYAYKFGFVCIHFCICMHTNFPPLSEYSISSSLSYSSVGEKKGACWRANRSQ